MSYKVLNKGDSLDYLEQINKIENRFYFEYKRLIIDYSYLLCDSTNLSCVIDDSDKLRGFYITKLVNKNSYLKFKNKKINETQLLNDKTIYSDDNCLYLISAYSLNPKIASILLKQNLYDINLIYDYEKINFGFSYIHTKSAQRFATRHKVKSLKNTYFNNHKLFYWNKRTLDRLYNL